MAELNLDLHPKQLEIYRDPTRFKVVCAGRRTGKTHLAAILMFFNGLSHPGGVGWAIAPSYSQTMIFWRKIREIIPRQYIKQIKEGDKCIILKNDYTIWMKSGDNADSLRGEGLDFAVLDEYATMKPSVWTEAIRPALGDKKGSALFIGTPKGKNGFYELAKKGMSEEFTDYKYFHGTSFDNTFIDPQEFVDMAAEMPEIIYKQEILAEFIEGGGEVFGSFEKQLLQPSEILEDHIPECFYVCGLDIAKTQDFTVLRIMRMDTGRIVFTDRFNQRDWGYQIRRIKSNLLKYNNPTCYVDSTGVGDPIYEKLRKEGLNVKGVVISSKSKPQLIENLSMLIEEGRYWMPDDKFTREEYSAFTYKIQDSGYIKYAAADGYHDDIVMADALCAWGLKGTCTCIGMMAEDNSEKSEYGDDRFANYDELESVALWG
jgi:hypothetical protein